VVGQKPSDVFRLFLNQGIQTLWGKVPEDGGGDGVSEQVVVESMGKGRRFHLQEIPVALDELKVRILQAQKIGESADFRCRINHAGKSKNPKFLMTPDFLQR